MKHVGWLTLAFLVLLLVNSSSTILAGNLQMRFASQDSIASKNVQIKSVTLLAREEKRLPLGQLPDPNRAIGFASVFLRIENSNEEDANLVIQKIEIRNASDGTVQAFSQLPQEIRLRPLENAENVFHLTNQTGYLGQGNVKAVITYQIGSQMYVIESAPVDVERP